MPFVFITLPPSPSLQAGSFAKIAYKAIFLTLGPLKFKGRRENPWYY